MDDIRALTNLIDNEIAPEFLRLYRGIILSQDPKSYACQVKINDASLGFPVLASVPVSGHVRCLVAPNTGCIVGFDDQNAVRVIGIDSGDNIISTQIGNSTNAQPVALAPAVVSLLKYIILMYNAHVHASNGAPPTTPLVDIYSSSIPSATVKISP